MRGASAFRSLSDRYGCWPSTSLPLPQGLACSHCGQEDSSLGAPPACGGRVPRRVGPLDMESGRVAAAFSRKLEAAASQGGRTDSREAPGPVGGALGVLKGRALAGRTGLGDSRGEVCMGVPPVTSPCRADPRGWETSHILKRQSHVGMVVIPDCF